MTSTKFEITNENGVIRGVIKKPEVVAPKGVLLCLHGGPNGNLQGNTGIFDEIAKTVVPLNFAIVQFSMYGSPPSDGTQVDTSLNSQIIDYDSVYSFVTNNFTCPIHIVGESAGVTIASMKWKDVPKSYILLWPAFDLRDTDLKPYLTNNWQSEVVEKGYLNDNGLIIGKDFFFELLLTDFSQSYILPSQDILIIHGQSDSEVPYSQSLKAISHANGFLKLITIKEAGHGFKNQSERKLVLKEIAYWLNQY